MAIDVQGTRVECAGAQGPVVLMVHGWPDTLALWDGTVAALQERFRCARLTLPGFEDGPQAVSLDAMCSLLLAVAEQLSPDQPIVLLLHDWGCVFGYEFATRHPQRVSRVIALDVGDHNAAALRREWRVRDALAVFVYQVWLALAWKIGGTLGTRMTRAMARWLGCPAAPAGITHRMNYPYAMQWLGVAGGLARAAPVQLSMPMMFVYGKRKPFMFHSRRWLAHLEAQPTNAVLGLPCGHWVMLDQPTQLHAAMLQWLASSPAP